MDCERCRSLLSGFIDRELPLSLARDVREHASHCPHCARELRGLRTALGLVRESGREEPPSGLEDAILDRVRALPPAVPKRRGVWLANAAPWVGAAAALLLVGLSLLYALHLRGELAARDGELVGLKSRQAALDEERLGFQKKAHGLEEEKRGLERELRATLDGAALEKAERERLAADLRSALSEMEEARRQAERAGKEKEEGRLALESRLAALEEIVGRQAGRVSELEGELATARESVSRANVDSTSRKRASQLELAAAVTQEAQVRFRRRDGRLEIEVRGRREAVVPELLRIACGGGDEGDLALASLEGILGPVAAERPDAVDGAEAPSDADLQDLWTRGFQHVAGRIGLLDAPAAEEPSATSSGDSSGANRTERLRRLERAWQALSGPAMAQED